MTSPAPIRGAAHGDQRTDGVLDIIPVMIGDTNGAQGGDSGVTCNRLEMSVFAESRLFGGVSIGVRPIEQLGAEFNDAFLV